MANEVGANKVVSLAYTLKLKTGEIVDYSEAGEPLEYLHGAGNIIPGLETALEGLKIGDTRDVEIDPKDGYGDYDPEEVQTVGRDMIPSDIPLQLGMTLMVSDEEGNEMEAYVREIGPDHVALDFNHPLAGQVLFFNVEIVDVREATEEEIEHGHPHSMGFHDDDEDFDEFEMEFDDEDEDDEEDYPSGASRLN